MSKKQSDRLHSDHSNKNFNIQANSIPNLNTLIQAFERLAAIENMVAFHVQFEQEQRQSGLRLSTFKASWAAWNQTRRGGDA